MDLGLNNKFALLTASSKGLGKANRHRLLGDGPVGDPADVGKVVCLLCSDPARFVSGVALQDDGATTTGLL